MNEPAEELSYLEHLDQLRSVLLKILICLLVCCIPCWFLAQLSLDFLIRYAVPEGFKLHYFSLMEPFLTRLKITFVLAVFCSLPFSAFWIWRFIAPGLLPEERKMIRMPALSMFLLALAGAAVSAFFIVPALVRFSLSFSGPDMLPVIGVGDFTGLILAVLLAAMLLFQFPVVLYLLLWMGPINLSQLRSKRPHIIVLIFILSAVFSPPDVMSQLLLAIPAWGLFEASLILFSKRFPKKDHSLEEIYRDADKPRQSNLKGENV